MKRVLFYVQHLLGIGHLARASRIAQVLAENEFDVTMVSGGMPVPGFPGLGIEVVQLPPIRSSDEAFSKLVDVDGREIGEAFKTHRRDKLLSILRQKRPDVLIVEAFPFDRRQMRFELLPFLEEARALQPRPLIATSIRDILQESRKQGRAEETVGLVRSYFDLVLVHGDSSFTRLEDTFPLVPAIEDRTIYTGLVAGPEVEPGEKFDVVVSAGGGAAGGAFIEIAIAAAKQSDFGKWCIITGPNLHRNALALPTQVSLFAFRPDFPQLLAAAAVSVSQAGYNSVCDLLRARCRSVLVPFAADGETEQTRRAAGIAGEGRATVVSEADLNVASLKAAIAAELGKPRPSASHLNLAGAVNTVSILQQHLKNRE